MYDILYYYDIEYFLNTYLHSDDIKKRNIKYKPVCGMRYILNQNILYNMKYNMQFF